MTYPSTFSSFNRPQANDRLNSPSHSALHNTVSSAVGQLEAVIGLEGSSSAVGTINYDLRSPASGGGGHIQTANKGGTGQTMYAKGDLLVGQSSSVLTKLSAGNDNQVLLADSAAATGIKWGQLTSANKVAINTSSVLSFPDATPTVLFAASVAGSILGSNNAIKFTGALQNFGSNATLDIVASYGNNTAVTLQLGGGSIIGTGPGSIAGTLTGMITANGSTSSQLSYMMLNVGQRRFVPLGNLQIVGATSFGTSSTLSDAPQSLVITSSFVSTQTGNSILTGMFVVEKVV